MKRRQPDSSQATWFLSWVAFPVGVLLFFAVVPLLGGGLRSEGVSRVAFLALAALALVGSTLLVHAAQQANAGVERAYQPTRDAGGYASLQPTVFRGAAGIGSLKRVSAPLALLTIDDRRLVISVRGGRLLRRLGGFDDIQVARSEVTGVSVGAGGWVSLESVDRGLDPVWFVGDPVSISQALYRYGWPLR